MWHKLKKSWLVMALVAVVVLASGTAAQADTIIHGSTTINMDFVNVGNPGNTGELSGSSAGGWGPDAIVGAVGYNYRIGTYEVTAAQWAAVRAADSSVGNAGNWSGSQPTAGTSWHEAAKFSNWLTTGSATSGYYTIAGGLATPNALSHDAYAAAHGLTYFIPTEDEWYKAAYYKGSTSTYYNYPTGSDSVPTAVTGGTAAGTAVFNSVYPSAPADVNNAGGLSPYGTMGQGGNVWEWNEALIASSSRGLRGGGWDNISVSLAASARRSDNPTYEYSSVGFRVASVPEPGSLAMLVGIALTALLYYWRKHV